ncbi:hypothetical protein K491DRAFT_305726 [Lophiostoma macrostomum CBS 122681]|uniref:Uncharacterized protein n=1 Tax=Lophiostoma macrostomum CBS 122681 TaxID=1314788 RepID=A0A6A6TEZ2_9PLEO|nr:hypothetical protein K491DRAFT_305726 [Lophiostoma macrostomum CBS 122681]
MIQSNPIQSQQSIPPIQVPIQSNCLLNISYPAKPISILTHRPHIPIPETPNNSQPQPFLHSQANSSPAGESKRGTEKQERGKSAQLFEKIRSNGHRKSARGTSAEIEKERTIQDRSGRKRKRKEEGRRSKKSTQKPGCHRNASSCKQNICLP